MGWLWGSSDDKDASSSSNFDGTYGNESNYQSSYDSNTDISSSGIDGYANSSAQGSATGDAELKKFIAMEQQRAELQQMIHKMNDVCWNVCMGTPESKLSSRTETCISNCVDRYIDSSLYITNRFAQLLSKSGGLS